jgi:hypothetical protein
VGTTWRTATYFRIIAFSPFQGVSRDVDIAGTRPRKVTLRFPLPLLTFVEIRHNWIYTSLQQFSTITTCSAKDDIDMGA